MIGFHRDNSRTHNSLKNLRWDTPTNNNKNITKLGGQRLFSYAEADAIRARLKAGETALNLSVEFGCTRRHIYNIKNRVQYVEA